MERHDAIISFKLLYGPMLDALDQCRCMHDSESSVKARMVKVASTQAEFIVAISVLSNFLAGSLDSHVVGISADCEYSSV